MPECVICTRPTVDAGYACWPDTDRLRDALEFVVEAAGELDVVVTRQARGATLVGGRSAESPLPFDAAASEVAWAVRNTMSTWCRLIVEQRGIDYPADTVAAMATLLRDQLPWLRCQAFAAEAFDELTYACWLLRTTIDRKPDLVYVGPCGADTDDGPCDVDLRAAKTSDWVTCPGCGARHDRRERTRWLLRIAYDRLMTASEIASVVTAWGQRLPAETVRSWVHRGRLMSRGTHSGAPIYRLGDALDLAEAAPRRRSMAAA